MFNLDSITLVEASFKRQHAIDFEKEINNLVDVSTESGRNQNVIGVTLLVKVKGVSEKKNQYEISVKTVGAFSYSDENDESIEMFSRINGPAIIFPFVRETMASLSSKAGIQTILLPPLNFTKFDQNLVNEPIKKKGKKT